MRKMLVTSVALAAAVAMVVTTATPAFAFEKGSASYDGYCYAKKSNKERDDMAKGAAIGAVAGAIFGKKKKKVKTAIIGAAVGAAAGYVVAKSSKEKISCSDGRYYVYSRGYYDPALADEGYKVVFFEARPSDVALFVRTNGQDVPYKHH